MSPKYLGAYDRDGELVAWKFPDSEHWQEAPGPPVLRERHGGQEARPALWMSHERFEAGIELARAAVRGFSRS